MPHTTDENIDNVGKKALWNILREYGFVSLMGLESCNGWFGPVLGTGIQVDHSINEFY